MGKIAFLRKRQVQTDEMSDKALVAACSQGDMVALGLLFDRYHLDVFRFISRLTGVDSADLDDLVQNTFLQVQRSAGKFSGRSAVKSWIFGIAINLVRHHVRSDSCQKKTLKVLSDIPPADAASPYDNVAVRMQLNHLQDALDRLPPHLKECFVMCDIEGVAGVEAAAILGVRKGTLWRRLHEARKALVWAMERRQA
jgi:RNA polymerase sigma-70 factor, ECF subfamily